MDMPQALVQEYNFIIYDGEITSAAYSIELRQSDCQTAAARLGLDFSAVTLHARVGKGARETHFDAVHRHEFGDPALTSCLSRHEIRSHLSACPFPPEPKRSNCSSNTCKTAINATTH